MSEREKLNEFEPATYEAWLKLVERDLGGAPFEKKLVKRVAGIEVQPLYLRAESERGSALEDGAGLPGFSPFTRGNWALGASEAGWDVRQVIAAGEPEDAASSILEALNGGATSLFLQLDRAARAASSEHGVDGLSIENASELDAVLTHVPLDKVAISIDGGASALALAAGLAAVATRRKLPLGALSGSFGIDPLGTLAKYGQLTASLELSLADAAEAARWASEHAPRVRALTVDVTPYHEAGADAALEIAVALATGIEYLRVLTRAGLTVDVAARQIEFRLSIGSDFFLEIAKLRAARRAWARVVEAAGGGVEAQAFVVHALTSRRTKTQRDPWVNMLRGTAESFSAAMGGAVAISTASFDAELGDGDAFAQRMARNTQHLLRHESNVHRVVDPAGGSYYVEALTEGLAARAWERLQHVERAGGLARSIVDGSLQQELKGALESERRAVETRRTPITGINEFPHVREQKLERPEPTLEKARARAKSASEWSSGALEGLQTEQGRRFASALSSVERGAAFGALRSALAGGTPVRAVALVRERLAQPFENLRDRADRELARSGSRPSVFLVNLGPIPEHKARAGFAQNFFEAGGFAALGNDGFASAEEAAQAFAASGASIAVLCSSDALYEQLAEPTARALQQRGARAIVLAGNPTAKESSYRAAGVTDFIYMGVNAVDILRSLLERAGAQP